MLYSAVPGELLSKFTTTEKPYIQYGADYVMQTSKYLEILQIMRYGHSILQETAWK